MNAKHSLSTISLIVMLLCAAGEVRAQSFYERVLQQNLWNDGIGVNGIRESSLSVAEAELGAGLENGGFKSASQGETQWDVNASTRAIRHLDKFSMVGAFGFSEMQGQNMCGPMSINPGYYPVEVWEFTPGKKTLQSYVVDGGISVDLSDEFRLGGRFKMNSQNYSKRKDIRHTNYRLDLECAAGLMWHGSDFAIEFSGILGKNSETITAEQVGTTVSSYYAFLDKGQMYGEYELWNGSGIHLNESGVSGLPLKEIIYGAALEAGFGQSIFASLQYRHSNGTAGEKEYVWYLFPGDRVDGHVSARFGGHLLRLAFQAGHQTNNEAVLDKVTSGGVTTVSNYGTNQILERSNFGIQPSYVFEDDNYIFRAGIDFRQDNSTASQMYPYISQQCVRTLDAVIGNRFIFNNAEIELSAGYAQGWIDESDSKVAEIGTGTQPQRYSEGYDIMYEYTTMPRAHTRIQSRWYPKSGAWYIGASGQITRALRPVSILGGRIRTDARLSIGIEF